MDAKSKSGGELDISAMSELQYLTCVIKGNFKNSRKLQTSNCFRHDF